MSLHNEKDNYLNQVIAYVKFPYDRKKIYQELDDHIMDRCDDFVEEGYNHDQALTKAIALMGDAELIGKELNRMHNPLLGWVWKISDYAVKLIGIILIASVVMTIVNSRDSFDPYSDISENSVLYHLELEKTAQIDDEIITLTDIYYDDSETLHVFFTTQRTGMMIFSDPISSYVGVFTDGEGKRYAGASNHSSRYTRNIIHKELWDFPATQKRLNVVYDYVDRHYEFHIDLSLEDQDA